MVKLKSLLFVIFVMLASCRPTQNNDVHCFDLNTYLQAADSIPEYTVSFQQDIDSSYKEVQSLFADSNNNSSYHFYFKSPLNVLGKVTKITFRMKNHNTIFCGKERILGILYNEKHQVLFDGKRTHPDSLQNALRQHAIDKEQELEHLLKDYTYSLEWDIKCNPDSVRHIVEKLAESHFNLVLELNGVHKSNLCTVPVHRQDSIKKEFPFIIDLITYPRPPEPSHHAL